MLEWYDEDDREWKRQAQVADKEDPDEFFVELNKLLVEMARERDFTRARWRVATYTLAHSFELNFKGVRHERD